MNKLVQQVKLSLHPRTKRDVYIYVFIIVSTFYFIKVAELNEEVQRVKTEQNR